DNSFGRFISCATNAEPRCVRIRETKTTNDQHKPSVPVERRVRRHSHIVHQPERVSRTADETIGCVRLSPNSREYQRDRAAALPRRFRSGLAAPCDVGCTRLHGEAPCRDSETQSTVLLAKASY